MNGELLVLRVSRYTMVDEKTGEAVTGTKVTYCQSLDSEVKENSAGVVIVNGTMPYEAYSAFTTLPAFYNMEFDMKANSKGKAELVPVKAVYSRPLLKGS